MVLITGGNGFLGRALAQKLKPSFHVLSVGRSSPTSIVKKEIYTEGSGSLSSMVLDVTDSDAVKSLFRDFPITTVVHLAGPTTHHELVHEKGQSLFVNWTGTYHLLNEFVKSSKAQRFIYSSSGKVYSPMKGDHLNENSDANPTSILGNNKRAVERLIEFMAVDLPASKSLASARIFNVFGPGQKESFLVPTIVQQLKNSSALKLGNLTDRRDYIFSDDVVTALETLILKPESGLQYYNIGSGHDYSAQDILDVISKLTGKKISTQVDASKLRSGETSVERSQVSKLEALGWKCQFSLEQGLKKFLELEAPQLLQR